MATSVTPPDPKKALLKKIYLSILLVISLITAIGFSFSGVSHALFKSTPAGQAHTLEMLKLIQQDGELQNERLRLEIEMQRLKQRQTSESFSIPPGPLNASGTTITVTRNQGVQNE